MSDGFENSKHCFGFSDRLVKKANHEQFMSRILLKKHCYILLLRQFK